MELGVTSVRREPREDAKDEHGAFVSCYYFMGHAVSPFRNRRVDSVQLASMSPAVKECRCACLGKGRPCQRCRPSPYVV